MSVERTQTVFDYVNRTGIRMMPFIRVPKFLLEEPLFRIVSVDAVLLYSILLDRLELSLANDWFDEHGHAYVIYTLKEIQKVMRCGHDKAIRMLRELDTEHGIGLIERIRVGQGQPSIIYVKVYVPKTRTQEIGKTEFWNSEDSPGRTAKSVTNGIPSFQRNWEHLIFWGSHSIAVKEEITGSSFRRLNRRANGFARKLQR